MKIIALDPGHGGLDPGAVGNGLYEKYITWTIANLVKDKLSSYDAQVHVIQPSASNPNSTANDELVIPPATAKELGADFYLSVHVNAGGGTGFESYVYNGETNYRTNEIRSVLHLQIMNYLKKYSLADRGQKSANFYVLRKCSENGIPAVLIECLFIDNQQDAQLLSGSDFINGLANEIAYGLVLALGLEKLEETATGRNACPINIKGSVFPGYLQGGDPYFAEGVPVKEVMKAISLTVEWDEEKHEMEVK